MHYTKKHLGLIRSLLVYDRRANPRTSHRMSLCAMNGLLFSPFSLAERSASSRDEAAIVLVLLSVVLQEGVLVPVQVVHQVTIATVLCHQEQWP